jgi:hypothetical protein
MMRTREVVGVCLLTGLSFTLGATLAGRRTPRWASQLPVVATVNGENLTHADLQIALSVYRRSAIEDLVAQRLLQQEALNKGISVEPEANPTPEPGVFADEAQAIARQAISRRLRRKLSLAKFSEDEKKQAFADLSPELRQYTLQVIVLKNQNEYPFLQRELSAGATFDSLIPKYTTVPGSAEEAMLSNIPRSTVAQLLGPFVADSLLLLQPGQVSSPTPSPLGPAVVKLLNVKQTYPELQERFEDVLVESEALALDYRLGSQAFVTSPYVPELTRRSKLKIKGEKPLDLKSLKPIASTAPHPLPRSPVEPLRNLEGPLLDTPPSPTPAPVRPATPISSKPQAQPTPLGIIKANIERSSHRLLAGRMDGLRVLRLDTNDNHHADPDEPVLVKISPDGWKCVENLDHSLNRFSLEHDYGYWSDRARIGWKGLWVEERAPNGLLEADEVTIKRIHKSQEMGNIYEIGAEVYRDEEGRLFHREQRAHYSRNTEVDRQDLRRLQDYRDSNANWTVSQE